MTAKPVVLNLQEWNPLEVKYLPPKVNDKGGKTINIISKQNNRSLSISTPLMMTWGISDYVDEKGESDNKFTLSLTFPNDDYRNTNTDLFLQKLIEFENKVIDDAVTNSELWFGDTLGREVVKHMFFPILKYSKNKDTKKIDYSKPPTLRAKVPNYNGKWNVEIYDTKMNLIFPCDDEQLTPIELVPKLSSVACVLNFGTCWVGGKGFGVQLKVIQAVVKPRLIESVYGKCHIQLSSEEKNVLDNQDKEETMAVNILSTGLSTSTPPFDFSAEKRPVMSGLSNSFPPGIVSETSKRPITEVDSEDELEPQEMLSVPDTDTCSTHPSMVSSETTPVLSEPVVVKKKIVKKVKA
jgi:Protein of unknown function (DUF2738)